MKTFKKILCALLVVVMCLTSAPLQGFVGLEWPSLPEINFGEFELPKIDFSKWFGSKASAAETMSTSGVDENGFMWASDGTSVTITGHNPSRDGSQFYGIMYNGHYYGLSTSIKTWTEAKIDCEANGGHLVTITDEAEQKAIQKLLSFAGSSDSWIGATDEYTEGEWTWCNGEEFTYTNWASGEPNNQSEEDYAIVYADNFKWNDGGASTILNYICEWDSTPPKGSFSEYKFYGLEYNGHYYGISQNKLPWNDAKTSCENVGGQLVSINTKDEQDFVETLLRFAALENHWIGAHKVDDLWQWVDGEVLEYDNWDPGEPNGNADTAQIYYGNGNDKDFHWDDTPGTFYYICEWSEEPSEDYFKGCTFDIVIPEKINGLPVTVIADSAFANKKYISSIEIPDSVITIGNHAFDGCTNLEVFELPSDIETLGRSIIANTKVKAITIPASLKIAHHVNYYGNAFGAFLDSAIESVVFKDGIETIPTCIFKGCSTLTNIDIPGSVTLIADSAFEKCTSLVEVEIPDSVITIGNHAFDGCINLEKVTMPTTITTICNYAFSDCAALESIDLHEGIITIGGLAFKNCKALEEVIIPSSLVNAAANGYNNGIFNGCDNLRRVTFAEGTLKIPNEVLEDASAVTNVIIPEGVTTIGNHAFYACRSLNNINLPDSITEIGAYAFGDCTLLESIDLHEGITTIGGLAFKNCKALEEVTIPSSLVNAATNGYNNGIFNGCDNLRKVTFAEGTLKIPNEVLEDASAVTNIIIPKGITAIGSHAFYACASLENIVLPEAVTSIGNYAFGNCASLKNIIIPKSVKTIGNYAFQNCSSLEWCSIENDNISISNSAFSNCPELYINCNEDSDTILSVIDKEINYTFINSGIKDKADRVLDRSNTYYRATTSSTSLSNAVTMIVDYKIKDALENAIVNNVTIKMPQNVYIVEGSLKIDGEVTTNYSTRNNVITIPVSKESGQIIFALNFPEGCYPSTYARLNYKVDGQSKSETIGIVNILYSSLTLNLPKESPESTITVSGLVAPETTVDIYVNEILVKSTSSSKTGVYYTEFEIPDAKFGRQYTITAKAMLKDGEKSASGKIRLLENTPNLKEFLFYYEYAHTGKEKCIDLLSLNGKRPSTIVYIHSPMRFVIDIDNPETIEQVYVTSTKNGDKKYIEAVFDEATGKYIAEGYFEPTNVSYVPGTLNVEYTQKKKTASGMADEIIAELMSSDNSDKFPEELLSGDYTVIENTEDRYEASIILGDKLANLAGDELKMIIETVSADFSGDLSGVMDSYANFYSYFVEDENGNPYYVNLDYTDPETYAVIVNDISSNKVFNLILEFHDDPAVYSTIDDVISTVDNISFVSGFIVDQLGIQSDHEDLVSEIYANTKDPVELAWKLKKAEELEQNRQMYSTTMMLMKFAALAAIPVVGPEMAMATITFNILLNAFDIMADFAWDLRKTKILYGSSGYNINMLMDPSGFVYEATESNRLEGVTATIYYQDPETGKAIKWNAEDYDQVNPQITDDAGQYAWDVLEGMWQVKFEKDGYETTYSEWLPVPPPQLEVNIGMTTTEAPKVTDLIIEGNTATVEFSQLVDVATVKASNCIVKIGNNIANGSWVAVDADTYVKDENMQIAKKFIFTANKVFGDNYSISISNVINYAGITMKEEFVEVVKPDVHEHTFKDGESKCSDCDYDKADDCGCNCHKGGIAGFFFKLILFFQKIFKSNKECNCGKLHY